MKILFAVSNEKITEQVVAKYQIMYNELLSYKEVYYYNAVVKELEKNKDYDAIVIDESLESVSNDKGDQYLLNNLDAITDIAVNNENTQIPIILICKADRQPAEEFLEKKLKELLEIEYKVKSGERDIDIETEVFLGKFFKNSPL